MEYVAPLESADPDASYVNEDAATNTPGSPVPAAAIEHPMREIVNVITVAGLTPSGGTLTQLGTAITTLITGATSGALRASVSSAVTAAYPALALAAAAVEGVVTLDFAARDNHAIAVTSDITIALPTGGVVGNQYYVEATQDATGGHAATFAAGWIVRQGEWSTDPNAINCLYVTVTGGGPVVDIAQAAEV